MQSTDLEEIRVRAVGAGVSSVYTGELGGGASDGSEKEQGATTGPASGAGALVSRGGCDRRSGRSFAQLALATSKTATMSVQFFPSEVHNGTRRSWRAPQKEQAMRSFVPTFVLHSCLSSTDVFCLVFEKRGQNSAEERRQQCQTHRPCLNLKSCWTDSPMSNRPAGTTAGCGSPTGERARSSRSIWTATAKSPATDLLAWAGPSTGCPMAASWSRARSCCAGSRTGRWSGTPTSVVSLASVGTRSSWTGEGTSTSTASTSVFSKARSPSLALSHW